MSKSCFFAEFALLTYQDARELQIELVAARKSGVISNDILLLWSIRRCSPWGVEAGGKIF